MVFTIEPTHFGKSIRKIILAKIQGEQYIRPPAKILHKEQIAKAQGKLKMQVPKRRTLAAGMDNVIAENKKKVNENAFIAEITHNEPISHVPRNSFIEKYAQGDKKRSSAYLTAAQAHTELAKAEAHEYANPTQDTQKVVEQNFMQMKPRTQQFSRTPTSITRLFS